jgi:hypothetical protein
MKKKLSIFLCVFAALFFASCTDLSVDEEGVLNADLPSDFDWKKYAEINNDVASSQVIFGVREKNKAFSGTDSAQKAISNCVNLLQSEALAQKVYLEYAGCPKEGWNRDEKCTGIYANNSNYNKPVIDSETKDTISWQCIMGTNANSEICWRGGWDETIDTLKPLKDFLQDTLSKYLEKIPTTISFVPIRTMCMFIPDAAGANEALSYLEDVKLDSVLIIKQYKSYGRNDGRPYKLCKGNIGVEKTPELADKRGTYYDYGRYTFCLNETDQKIYVVK